MSDVQAEAGHLEIIFHDDDETPVEFVIELLHSVFKKQLADAIRFTEAIKQHGQESCGTYPRDVANKLLKSAQKGIRAIGVPLRITSQTVTEDDDRRDSRCKLCGALSNKNLVSRNDMAALVCNDCMYEVSSKLPEVVRKRKFGYTLRRAGLAFRRYSAGSVGRILAAVSRSYARGCSSCRRPAVLRIADPVFRHPRALPL